MLKVKNYSQGFRFPHLCSTKDSTARETTDIRKDLVESGPTDRARTLGTHAKPAR